MSSHLGWSEDLGIAHIPCETSNHISLVEDTHKSHENVLSPTDSAVESHEIHALKVNVLIYTILPDQKIQYQTAE